MCTGEQTHTHLEKESGPKQSLGPLKKPTNFIYFIELHHLLSFDCLQLECLIADDSASCYDVNYF